MGTRHETTKPRNHEKELLGFFRVFVFSRFRAKPPLAMVGTICLIALSTLLRAAAPSPVADAARNRDRDAARTLLQRGADVNAPHGDGMTALHWAATNGDRELASMLVAAGANLRATTRLGAYTALHLASDAGDAAMIALLADAGAHVDARTTTGATP